MESCKLPDVPLFRGLTETEAAAAIEALRMRRRPFAKGEVLLEAGRTAPPLGVVLAGRVHILEVPNHPLQAAALALNELQRLYALREDTREGGRWGHFAVLGREHKDLDAIYHLARQRGLAVRRIAKNKDDPNITLHTAREGAGLLALLRGEKRCQQLAPRLSLIRL